MFTTEAELANGTLTRSFLPNMVTLPLVGSRLILHSMEFRPLSVGSVMFRRQMVGLTAPAKMCGSVRKLMPMPLAYKTRSVPL